MTDQFLTLLLLYGYPILFGTVLVGAIGVPLPATILLLAAGGFAADGDLDLIAVIVVVFAAAVLGDCASFAVARRAGIAAVHRFGGRFGVGEARLQAVENRFGGWTMLSIFLTRWLITPLALPVNVVAAVGHYPLPGFIIASIGGEILWTGIYVGCGYVFGSSWSAVADLIGDSLVFVIGATLSIAAVAVIVAWTRRPSRT